MKVLHVLNHSLPNIDGYSQRSHSILRHQQKQGIEVVAVTSPKHENPQAEVEVVDDIVCYRTLHREARQGPGAFPFVKESLFMGCLRQRILEVARQERVDLIHAHSPSLNGIPARLVARQLNLPVVYELRALWEDAMVNQDSGLHSLRYAASRLVETWLLRRVDAVTTICEGLRREIVARGVSVQRVEVFPNGVDTARFAPRPVSQELKKRLRLEQKFVLGFIGSFYHWEGLDILLRALPLVSPQHPEVHLVLVGSQQEEAQLKQLSSRLQLDDRVTFAGRVASTEVLDYYSVLDLCVYPRKKMKLTELVTPLKPLEAMAMEKLVLASDVGGHRELIQDGRDGFLFAAGDEHDLARKIAALITPSSDLLAIRSQARQSVLEQRTWDKIVPSYLSLYQRLVSICSPDRG